MGRSRWLSAAALAGLLAGGCGGGDAPASAPAASATPAPTAASTSATLPTPTPTATTAPAQARRGVGLTRVGSFSQPVYVTAPPADRRRVFVVEQGGRIRVLRGGRRLARPFLDLRGRIAAGGERGLLSMAFAPDYARTGRFYVYFTDPAGTIRIVEYERASADRADPGSARLLLSLPHPAANHNGGLLRFGPDDLLYIGTGDGGGAGDRHGPRGNAQDLGSLEGKLLRIDPRPAGGRPYRVPTANPFVGRAGARGEVYAYGLRNPWRFAFDRASGDLTIGDVGQDAWEEVSFVRRNRGRGANFGWRPFEGRTRYAAGEPAPGHVAPVIVRSHRAGWCSITGGVVVRDPALPALRGRYVFGDFCQGRVHSARLGAGRARDVRATRLRVATLSSFGEDARGRVYATSLEGGVFRFVAR